MAGVARATAKAHLTAHLMSDEVKSHLKKSGWDADVADNVSVHFEGDKFNFRIHPDYAERAWVHEYGSPEHPPTAALRKYGKESFGGF
jgi:hypothetical protein